ncbi:hypothetical protein [Nocardioides lijunqiniae]|uniref:hypothetical protein n=1 Tax=Nocardioides lijunqiniae TaxID=2760832 RepID=UPI001877BACD|nr:hypothetical protein [Nocardioides lijunqiniae]
MKIRLSAAAALTVMSLGVLTACGGDDEPADEPSSSASESESSSDDATPSPSEPETEPEAEPEDGAADGDKPERDVVISGYEKIITAQTTVELPADIVKQTATCFVDEIYDDASAQTLQAIADEKPEGIDPSDASLFTEATTACTKAG